MTPTHEEPLPLCTAREGERVEVVRCGEGGFDFELAEAGGEGVDGVLTETETAGVAVSGKEYGKVS